MSFRTSSFSVISLNFGPVFTVNSTSSSARFEFRSLVSMFMVFVFSDLTFPLTFQLNTVS